ncbi:MAG: CHASE2 domain-containing protein [Cyanobacteria bacterium P01_E01_bin.35]
MNQDQTRFSYQIGGSLAYQSPSYVERKADRELEQALQQGQFCYVLNSRQMGKSSLRIRAMAKLQAAATVCIFIDLTGMGTQELTSEKWYAGIMRSLVSGCQLQFDWRSWWREQRDLLTPVQRLSLFIESVLLREIKQKIVIFIDEIDRVLSQKFSLDDFFALIHSCYQQRQINADYDRLTFTLLGVAAPRDLIEDKTQSPFNLGTAIKLEGFQIDEASPLMLGLIERVPHPRQILTEILAWTGGQPFLTQKLCQLVVEQAKNQTEIKLSTLIEKYLIYDWETQDEPEHFRTIRDRLCYRNSRQTIRLLGLYRQVLQHQIIPSSNSSEQIELRLSGLLVTKQQHLVINNPIYANIFDLSWVDKQLAQLRPYQQKLTSWRVFPHSAHLLQGKDLQDALTWALGKSLADIDYQFLVASQDLAKQRAEDTLAVVEAASHLLASARKQAQKSAVNPKLARKWLLMIALMVAGLVLLLRCTGILQSWEWNLLDRFFNWRLAAAQDNRIVVVTIDERDLQTVGQWPLSDRLITTAIRKIQAQQPSAIALDIYRDLPVPPGNQDLLELFNSTANLYVVTKIIGDSISPPPISQQQVGFADQVLDSDGKIRRALLSLVDNQGQTRFSLGTKLALHYLQEQAIDLESLDGSRYRLGKAIFNPLTANSGGYVGADTGGYQILINFWGTAANFKQYSLIEVLNDEISAADIQNRLVLIGSTAESLKDTFYTPYSQSWFRSPPKMSGVFIQANVTSQLINAAFDLRPVLHPVSKLTELLVIFCGGMTGVAISGGIPRASLMLIRVCLGSIIFLTLCYYAFLLGWWLPLVPALLALITAVIAVILICNKQRDRTIFRHTLALLAEAYRHRPLVSRIALEYFKRSSNKDYSLLIEREINHLKVNRE